MHYHSQRDLYEELDGGRGAERIQRNKEVQVSDVKAAAERMRRSKYECDTDFGALSCEQIFDLIKVANAYLAEHPADDSEPLTADYLHTTSMEYCDIERKFIALDGDGHSLTYEAHGVMGWCFNGCSLHKQPRTRWELRRLADALGFDIKEGKA